jgi:hypothetical protein
MTWRKKMNKKNNFRLFLVIVLALGVTLMMVVSCKATDKPASADTVSIEETREDGVGMMDVGTWPTADVWSQFGLSAIDMPSGVDLFLASATPPSLLLLAIDTQTPKNVFDQMVATINLSAGIQHLEDSPTDCGSGIASVFVTPTGHIIMIAYSIIESTVDMNAIALG